MTGRDIETREKADLAQAEGRMVWVPPGFELSSEAPVADRGLHLWDYIWLIWRRRWLVFLIFLLSLGLALVSTMRAVSIYEGRARLLIKPEMPKILSFEDPTEAKIRDRNLIETERQILQSRRLAALVVEQLDLYAGSDESEETPTSWRSILSDCVNALRPVEDEPVVLTPAEIEASAMQVRVNDFLSNLTIDPLRDTQIVEVRFLGPDSAECAEVANALCEAYIGNNYKLRTESYNYARQWLKEKTEELEGKLEESEGRLYKFAEEQESPVFSGDTAELAALAAKTGSKLADAKGVLFEREFDWTNLEAGADLTFLSPEDSHLRELISVHSNLMVRYEEAKANLGPEMGEMKALEAAKKQMEGQLAKETAQFSAKVRIEYEQAKAECDFLQRAHDDQLAEIQEVQKSLVKYNILKRKVDVNKDVYNTLMQRWKELDAAAGLNASNVSIVDYAEPPRSAKYPRKTRNVMLGAFIGLLLGVSLAFFIDYMDTSVKGAEDIERATQMPVLGFISHFERSRRDGQGLARPELIAHDRPQSGMAENIRCLRTSIQYSLAGRSPRVILVTSAFPGEGKSTVAINLAITFSQRGQRTLLIDADLKRPTLKKFFDTGPEGGLTEILTGKADIGIAVESDIENLSVLTSGSKAPNPVDLLDSDVMRDLLGTLTERYDQIVIDTPPTMDMADTPVLAPYVDGVVLVVRPGKTPRAALRKVKEKLTGMQGKILGVVLNNPRQSPGQRRYGYSYGYGYGYGYGYEGYGYGYSADEGDEDEGPEVAEAILAESSLPSTEKDSES